MTFIWIIYLWLISTALGVVVFPLLFHAAPRLKDRGWGISRIVGLVVVGWLAWLLSSFKLVPFGTFGVLFSVVVTGAGSVWFIVRNPGEIKLFLKNNISLIAIEEVVFASALAIFLLIIAFSPDIAPNTEAMMDYALLNSIRLTDYFPPLDPWFAGKTINYYYYGFILAAALHHLTFIPLPVFFNLAVGLIYALFTLACFSLGFNLTGKKSGGLLMAVMGMFIGNLDGLIQLFQGRFGNFDFFRSSRVLTQTGPGGEIIDYPITEFPFFSLLWGDLHPYVIAYPLQAAVLNLLLNLGKTIKTGFSSLGESPLSRIVNLVLLSLSLGVLFGTNTWDYPIYLFLAILVLALIHWRAEGGAAGRTAAFIGPAAVLTILSFLLFTPFNLRFLAEQAGGGRGGIGLVSVRTPTARLLVHFGIFFFFLAVFALARIIPHGNGNKKAKLRMGPLALMVLIAAVILIQNPPLGIFASAVVMAGIFFLVFLFLLIRRREENDDFPCLLVLAGLGLILACEFFFLKDHYSGGGYFRMNTIFKLYIHAWIFLTVGAIWGIIAVLNSFKEKSPFQPAWKGITALVLALGLLYPWGAVRARLRGAQYPVTLDGVAYISRPVPSYQREDWRWDHDDWRAIEWINENIQGRPVILETAANAYHWAGRVSTFTGLLTLVGWTNHEAGWRNDWTEPARRGRNVDTIYSTTDTTLTRSLLLLYDVRYVFIGNLERKRYPSEGLDKFERLGEAIYRQGPVTIYRLGE